MKRNLFFVIGGAVMLSAVSCSIEENKIDPEGTESRVPMEFTAGLQTKTSIDENNAVLWSAGDAISVFDSQNNRFDIASEPGSASATFTGEAIPDYGTYYALYPYSADAALSGTTLSSVLPTEQYYANGTFATMLNPSVAIAAGGSTSLSFHNVASILQVNVNVSEAGDRAVRNIQVSAAETMTGAYTVAMGGDTYFAEASGSDILGASLAAEDGGNMGTDFNGDGLISYYIVVLPGDYTDMTVTVNYSDGAVSESSFASVTMPASGGNILNVNAAEAEIPGGLYGLYQAGQTINIAGLDINEATYGEAQLIESDATIPNTGSGVYFIDGDVTLTFGESYMNNLILIGNTANKKANVTQNGRISFTHGEDGSIFICHNIALNSTALTNSPFVSNKALGTYNIVFSECDITWPSNTNLISNANVGANYGMVAFDGCSFNYDARTDATNRPIIATGSSAIEFDNFIFNNNIIYSENIRDVRILNTNTGTVNNLSVTNNTFINAWMTLKGGNPEYFNVCNTGNVSFSDNLIWCNESSSERLYCLRFINSITGTASVGTNILYNEAQNDYRLFYGSINVDNISLTEVSDNPFENGTFDIKNGIFEPNSTYADYGAQR